MAKLTDRQIINARPTGKVQRLQDGRGLYLEITVAGSKYWRYRFQLQGRENRMSIGAYPGMTLADARAERDRLRALCKRGLDPVQHRKEAVAAAQERVENTFKRVAYEFFEVRADTWQDDTRFGLVRLAEINLLPWLGDRPVGDITPPELLKVLRQIEATGARSTAHKCKRLASQIFRFGIASGLCERDPSQDLAGALKPQKTRHFPAITDAPTLAKFLREVEENYRGGFVVHCAVKLLPLLMLRPGELRKMEWSEIDCEQNLIRIPAEKMKMRKDHLVPVAKQAREILDTIRPLTGDGIYVFPNHATRKKYMGETAIVQAIRRLGWGGDQASAHGFRATASTLLHEQGWRSELIEMQLAHTDRNQIRATYNRAEFLEDRRKMLQWWADFLDELKGAK